MRNRLEIPPHVMLGRIPHPDYANVDFFSPQSLWKDRKLGEIPRWSAIEQMKHRPDVGGHSIKVTAIFMFFGDMYMELGREIDQPLGVYMAQHHDDLEIPDMYDIPTPVKRNATRAEKRRMEKAEKKAVKEMERHINLPSWAGSYSELYARYKRQDTVEARMVKYADVWDALYEAVNEVICGENEERFREIIEENRPYIEEYNRMNRDWQPYVERFMGDDFFEIPEQSKLKPVKIEDVDFSSPVSLAYSISGENMGYAFWLLANQFAFRNHFFQFVLPGWVDELPDHIKEDLRRNQTFADLFMFRKLFKNLSPTLDPIIKREKGVLRPRKDGELTFAELLVSDGLLDNIRELGREIRDLTGMRRARGKYYNLQEYLDE